MAKSKSMVFGPKPDCAAEWRFTPSAATRKAYPDAPDGAFGMDLQTGEVMSLVPLKTANRDGARVVDVKEGHIHLLAFDDHWEVLDKAPEDVIEWDVLRIIEAWSSDD